MFGRSAKFLAEYVNLKFQKLKNYVTNILLWMVSILYKNWKIFLKKFWTKIWILLNFLYIIPHKCMSDFVRKKIRYKIPHICASNSIRTNKISVQNSSHMCYQFRTNKIFVQNSSHMCERFCMNKISVQEFSHLWYQFCTKNLKKFEKFRTKIFPSMVPILCQKFEKICTKIFPSIIPILY